MRMAEPVSEKTVVLTTDYYCKACREFFVEHKLPNINKVHHCGAVARIVWHEPQGGD